MVAGQFGENAFVVFAEAGAAGVERLVAAVVLGQFLFDECPPESSRQGGWPGR